MCGGAARSRSAASACSWRLPERVQAAGDERRFAQGRGWAFLGPSNVFARILKPAAKRAGVPWAGFHTFRHTAATLLFRHGASAKQVQLMLGHHSPGFTLATYVHLLPNDLPDPAFLDGITEGNERATEPTENDRNAEPIDLPRARVVPTRPNRAETAGAKS